MLTDQQIGEIIRKTPGTQEDIKQVIRSCGGKIGDRRFREIYRDTLAAAMGAQDVEVVEENIRLAEASQKQLDLNRIKNKSFREHARLSNALEGCGAKIVEILGAYDFSKVTVQHEAADLPTQGIVQLSDLHFNELVQMPSNTYDFEVAAKRLKKFAIRATEIFRLKGVKSVLVANTGDTLNSDRRLDEYLSQSTNRMNAAMLAFYLLEQFLLDLNRNFNVTYIQVSGNESRVKDEPGFTDTVLSDNYDQLIYNILKTGMRTAKGITFMDGDISERVFTVMGRNILITHGDNYGITSTAKDVQHAKGKYAQLGVAIDFVIFGHIHEAYINDNFARGGSLTGTNAYADRGLQVWTRASQNVHVFYRDGDHDSYAIGLQDTNGIAGYDIKKELESYNAKSEKKLHHQVVLHEIVI